MGKLLYHHVRRTDRHFLFPDHVPGDLRKLRASLGALLARVGPGPRYRRGELSAEPLELLHEAVLRESYRLFNGLSDIHRDAQRHIDLALVSRVVPGLPVLRNLLDYLGNTKAANPDEDRISQLSED